MNLFAISTKVNINSSVVKTSIYPIPLEERQGAMMYFRDCLTVRKTVPPISLTKTIIDFGRIQKSSKVRKFSGHTTSITNHTKNAIEVKWFDGKSHIKAMQKKNIIHGYNLAYISTYIASSQFFRLDTVQ